MSIVFQLLMILSEHTYFNLKISIFWSLNKQKNRDIKKGFIYRILFFYMSTTIKYRTL